MIPIPKALLIHSAQIQTVDGKDAWGKETLSEPVNLEYVRLEPSAKYVRDKSNNEIQLAAILFYDCYNSRPRGQAFKDGQILTFRGEEYRVRMVEDLYDGRRLHHHELGMIRNA